VGNKVRLPVCVHLHIFWGSLLHPQCTLQEHAHCIYGVFYVDFLSALQEMT